MIKCWNALKMVQKGQRSLKQHITSFKRYCVTTALSESEIEPVVNKYEVPVCYCNRDPLEQLRSDYKKMYPISSSLFNGPLADAVPADFQKLSTCIDDTHMMIRKPALDILDIMQQSPPDTVPKILINGSHGVGKSMTILQILHYCFLKNMVIIYIPHGGLIVDSLTPDSVMESSWNPSRIDQPEESIAWLNTFQALNSKFLSEEKTSQAYKWGKRDDTPAGISLMEILTLGKGRANYATDAVGVLLKEIQLNKKLQVLYAVDGVNWLFIQPIFKFNMLPVDMSSLSLLRHFTKLLKPETSITNGVCLTSTSYSVPFFKSAHHQKLDFNDIIDTPTWKLVNDHFIDVEVSSYNEEEYLTMMNFYKEKGWIQKQLYDNLVDQIRFLTARHPFTLYKMLRSL